MQLIGCRQIDFKPIEVYKFKNKENGNKRPCYYCIKSKKYDNIIWFIPVSTKIDKYKRIYDSKIQKQIKLGKNPSIDTIVFGDVASNSKCLCSIIRVYGTSYSV